jgi:hypothetical protein
MNLSPPGAATKKKNEPMNQQKINTEHTMRYQIPYPKQPYLVRIQNYYCEERGELHQRMVRTAVILLENTSS